MCSEVGSRIPLLANVGYADLFCFIEVTSTAVSTLKVPVGGRVNWNPLVGFISAEVDVALTEESCCERWEMRVSSDIDVEASVSLLERSRPSEAG
jgi:hypothetical protein